MKKFTSIFLIDDDQIVSFINRKVIESMKIAERIQTFDSGTHALDYLKLIQDEISYYQLFAPQVILLDINMPLMNGYQFLDEFNKLDIFKQKPIDIFMLSSSTYSGDIERANNYKLCSGYIIKPLSEEKLLPLLNDIRQKRK